MSLEISRKFGSDYYPLIADGANTEVAYSVPAGEPLESSVNAIPEIKGLYRECRVVGSAEIIPGSLQCDPDQVLKDAVLAYKAMRANPKTDLDKYVVDLGRTLGLDSEQIRSAAAKRP